MNADKYLEKIKYSGPKNVSVEVLKQLHFQHITNIPFDTLNMFGGSRKVLDLEVIYDNIVNKNRGGFCFELNGIFHWLLTSLGFKVHMLNGCVYDESCDKFKSKLDHLVLMVEFSEDEKWIADVGWGGNSIAYPMKFEDREEHQEKSGIYRVRKIQDGETQFHVLEKRRQQFINSNDDDMAIVTPENKEWSKSKWQEGGWQLLFKFMSKYYKLADFEEQCKELQDDKDGFLMSHRFLLKHTENGRMVLFDNVYYEREYVDPLTIKKTFKVVLLDDQSLYNLIRDKFDVELDFALEKLNK